MRLSNLLALLVLALPSLSLAKGEWEKISATYEVPASPELKGFAEFELSDARVRTTNGLKEIRYTLPLELTGTPKEIELTEAPDQKGLFTGLNARANCDADVCELRYPDLAIDRDEVLKFLETKALTQDELRDRLTVFELFRSGDPAGIVRLRKLNAYE